MSGRKKKNGKRKMIAYSVDESIMQVLVRVEEETGASRAEINRRALKQYLSTGQDEAVCMCNTILLQEEIKKLKDSIPLEDYARIQNYMGNILSIKGGKR